MSEIPRLNERPIHLGLGATAEVEPTFTGDMSWYQGYAERHDDDGAEGRLVTLHDMSGAWDVWEMHPSGAEVVCCIDGEVELVQELAGGESTTRLAPGEYAINPPGVWHTANDTGPCRVLFITAGLGTEHRPR